jgi:hypothetical protein
MLRIQKSVMRVFKGLDCSRLIRSLYHESGLARVHVAHHHLKGVKKMGGEAREEVYGRALE